MEISTLLSSTNISSSSDSETSDDEVGNTTTSPNSSEQILKSIPVSKWNLIKFSGENSKISLNAFLENVEDLCLSRNVRKDDLLNAGLDLFSGKALIWFRAMRKQSESWSDIVHHLKQEFHPPNFNEKLWQKIKCRTQGPTENIGLYLAVMDNLFNRWTIPVDEKT